MTLSYHNPQTDSRTGQDERQFTFEEARDLVHSLRGSPDATMVSTLPCGIGLDFHALDDGRIWLEFYADSLQAATVSPEVAEEVFSRAYFLPALPDPHTTFADLITDWDYY